MATKSNPSPGMMEVLNDQLNDQLYEAFLWGRAQLGDNGFLLAAVRSCNLRPSERKVIEDLINGKLRRLKNRPPSEVIYFRTARRALRVLDIERDGQVGNKRDAAIREAARQSHCSYSTIEKALGKFEDLLKHLSPELLDNIRSAYK